MTITSESLADFGVRNITAYATEVNLDRAVPELYDGLKPVFRRVAWSAHAFNPKETVKSAKIVGHCFAAGTKVLKREGQITVETPIEAIKVGHAVLTDAPCRFANDMPFRLVTKTFVIPQQKLLRVTTTTSTVDCTTDQVFYGADDREIQASKLLVGDKLKTVYCGELTLATVLSVDALTGLHDVYDIEVEQRHRFYANGLLSHNCIGSYHPHGDQACYGAMVTMVNSSVPLLDGIGNWGSLLDPPAAQRYTVCRLSKVGQAVMDSDYLAVTSMVPNYDDTTTEPVVLPAKLPFLILNGAEGIGVGITCSIPTFTVESVVDVLTRLLSGEKLKVTDLAKLLKPKQYYGGRLVNSESNKAQWLQLMKTGQASVEFEAPLEVDEAKKQITVGEWPNGLNPEKFVQKVRAMPETQRCYNSKGSTTFVIECKKAYNMVQFHDFVEKVRKLARAKSNYKFNCTHRVAKTEDGITTYQTQFLKLSVGQFIVQWLKLRIELEKRVINYRIAREQKAIDYSNLLLYASTKLDVIFKALRSSDAVAYMVRNMDVDETQAKAVLELKVRQLSKLDQAEIKQKLATQKKRMAELQANLKRPKNSVKKEMQSLLTLVKEDAILRDKKDNQKLIVK